MKELSEFLQNHLKDFTMKTAFSKPGAPFESNISVMIAEANEMGLRNYKIKQVDVKKLENEEFEFEIRIQSEKLEDTVSR